MGDGRCSGSRRVPGTATGGRSGGVDACFRHLISEATLLPRRGSRHPGRLEAVAPAGRLPGAPAVDGLKLDLELKAALAEACETVRTLLALLWPTLLSWRRRQQRGTGRWMPHWLSWWRSRTATARPRAAKHPRPKARADRAVGMECLTYHELWAAAARAGQLNAQVRTQPRQLRASIARGTEMMAILEAAIISTRGSRCNKQATTSN